MPILAVDTANGMCSIALSNDDGLPIAIAEEHQTSKQAERILPLIMEMLQHNNLTIQQLTLLCSTIGPGSFTGLRIGLTTIKGMALVTQQPTLGLTTLEVMMAHYVYSNVLPTTPHHRTLIILDARRDEVFAQLFDGTIQPLSSPMLLPITTITHYTTDCDYIGGSYGTLLENISITLPSLLPPIIPHASDAVRLAAKRYHTGLFTSLDPVYIRKPDAKLSERPSLWKN